MATRKNTPQLNKRYTELARVLGKSLALYCMCAVYDVPFYDINGYVDTWSEYIMMISEDEEGLFEDGITDVNIAMNGTKPEERWAIVWGEGDDGNPYTESDYRRLDQLFKTYSARLVSLGGYDAQQEDTLRNCCKMRLFADKCLAKGTKESIAMFTQLNKAIQTELASEGLRKVDAVQKSEPKIDTFVSKLEQAGLLEQGKILPLQEVQERLIDIMRLKGIKTSRKYPYTIDAADQMIYMIANNMYHNDDMPELTEMPDDLRFDSNVKDEFAELPNRQEKEAYARMGLVRGFEKMPEKSEWDGIWDEVKKEEKEAEEAKENEPVETFVVEKPIQTDEQLQQDIIDIFFGGKFDG